jgi:polyketide cyclase/dehydrase/lipid transport protein
MTRTFQVRHVSVTIDRPASAVYAFMSNGENLVRWATGLGSAYERDGDDWLVQGPDGLVRARLPKANEFGVVDHTVTLPTGVTVHIPIRVIPNGEGATVSVTLLRLDGASDEKFDADARWVERDLATLKSVLEAR